MYVIYKTIKNNFLFQNIIVWEYSSKLITFNKNTCIMSKYSFSAKKAYSDNFYDQLEKTGSKHRWPFRRPRNIMFNYHMFHYGSFVTSYCSLYRVFYLFTLFIHIN